MPFTEYRDPFIGSYKGIRVTRSWNSNIGSPPDTTFNFVTNFVKSTYNDSVIEAGFGRIHLHANGTGYPTSAVAPNNINYKCYISNDSLYYYCFTGNSSTGGLSTYFSGKKQ